MKKACHVTGIFQTQNNQPDVSSTFLEVFLKFVLQVCPVLGGFRAADEESQAGSEKTQTAQGQEKAHHQSWWGKQKGNTMSERTK